MRPEENTWQQSVQTVLRRVSLWASGTSLQLTLKNTAIFFLMHCGHLLIKMVRKVLFTHFPVAEKEIETGYKPFTKSCNNLVAELLTDAWISESFYPLLPWHRTPLLLASNFVWKTFLRKCYASEIWAS